MYCRFVLQTEERTAEQLSTMNAEVESLSNQLHSTQNAEESARRARGDAERYFNRLTAVMEKLWKTEKEFKEYREQVQRENQRPNAEPKNEVQIMRCVRCIYQPLLKTWIRCMHFVQTPQLYHPNINTSLLSAATSRVIALQTALADLSAVQREKDEVLRVRSSHYLSPSTS